MFHLLLCLPHLLTYPAVSLTTQAPPNTAGIINSPVVKLGASTEPPPSSLLDTRGTLAPGLTASGDVDSQSGHFGRPTGRGVHDSRAPSSQTSTARAPLNETSWVRGKVLGRGLRRVTTHADTSRTSESSKTSTAPVDPDAAGLIIHETNSTATLGDDGAKCKEEEHQKATSAPPSSRLVCFVTLWILGVTASLFLGLTICLWVRLSARQEQDKQRSQTQTESTPGGVLKDLWVAHRSSMEERVEFWYSSGSAIAQHTTTHNNTAAGKGREREGQEGGTGETEDRLGKGSLWTQPKVTLKDITDFWDSSRRPTLEEFTRHT